ncbi:MAG: hypothetical protein ACK4JY_10860 [Brevundimonas sp.]|uniref:hypothetical protein n=1 Tax=Brevundimonas sp. TaxID=1871086 RepID=UPI00391AD953
MAKAAAKVLATSRKASRGAPGPCPLLVIAGLPAKTAEIAAATINNDEETRWRAIAIPFGDKDPIYTAEAVVDLMVQTLAFAIRGHPDRVISPDPSRILLAHVGAPCSDLLLDGFGASVMTIPLAHPEWTWPRGQHWRFDIKEVMPVVRRTIRLAEADPYESFRLRLEAFRRDDALLLPQKNFRLTKTETLEPRFRDLLRGQLTPAQIDAQVTTRRFGLKELKRFYGKTGGKNQSFAYDDRSLVFAKAHVGQDGNVHEIAPLAEGAPDQVRLRRELEGRFRFGTPLRSPGFQHDVQWTDGKPLVREPFVCIDRTDILVSADHANVFASDVVTAAKIDAVEK